jgi:hypothetical protein
MLATMCHLHPLIPHVDSSAFSPPTAGQLLVVLVVPFKWLLRSHAQPVGAASASKRTWWQRFRHHIQQCIFDHPTVKAAAFLWTGKPWTADGCGLCRQVQPVAL